MALEEKILVSTKKTLGLAQDYTAFDQDIMTHINATFSVLNQLGVGPVDGFFIDSGDEVWGSFDVPDNQLNLVKSYVYLKVRLLFDPPTTSFLLDAMKEQINQFEWRLNSFREQVLIDEEVETV